MTANQWRCLQAAANGARVGTYTFGARVVGQLANLGYLKKEAGTLGFYQVTDAGRDALAKHGGGK